MSSRPATSGNALIRALSQPGVQIPASALMHAGLSAYGNALSQNELEKGDNRLILESILAGVGSVGGHTLLRGLGPRIRREASQLPAAEKAAIKEVLARNPELESLRRAMPAVGSLVLSGTGASLAGNVLAPFVAGNLNLAGLPGWSGRQQDYYEQDQEAAADPRVLAMLEQIQDGEN